MNLLDTKFPLNVSTLSRCVSSALHLMHPLHCSVQQNCDVLAISILEANGRKGKQAQSAEECYSYAIAMLYKNVCVWILSNGQQMQVLMILVRAKLWSLTYKMNYVTWNVPASHALDPFDLHCR